VLDLIGSPDFVSPELSSQGAPGGAIVSTGSGPVTARGGASAEVRALADEVTRLRAEVAELRTTVQHLERRLDTSPKGTSPKSTSSKKPDSEGERDT
jgi:hypothetical protein